MRPALYSFSSTSRAWTSMVTSATIFSRMILVRLPLMASEYLFRTDTCGTGGGREEQGGGEASTASSPGPIPAPRNSRPPALPGPPDLPCRTSATKHHRRGPDPDPSVSLRGPPGPPHTWRAPHLLLLQDLEDFLVSSLLRRQQALGDVGRPLDLTGRDHHLGPTQRLHPQAWLKA